MLELAGLLFIPLLATTPGLAVALVLERRPQTRLVDALGWAATVFAVACWVATLTTLAVMWL